MLRFIWDKIRSILHISLLLIVIGGGCALMFWHAGEDIPALVGLFTLGMGLFLPVYMLFFALRDALRWRRDFTLGEAMDEYESAQHLYPELRAGKTILFSNTVSLEYTVIRSMFCSHEHTSSARGHVTWWYILYAVSTEGKKHSLVRIEDQDSREEAAELFTRVMKLVAERNPQADLRYPEF